MKEKYKGMIKKIHNIVRRLDYTTTDDEVEKYTLECMEKIHDKNYDFSKYDNQTFTQGKKKRKIYFYEKMSIENVLAHYLKKQLDYTFSIKYTSRNKLINLMFNTLPAVKDLNDFVIIRADFKSFFDSVLTEHVFRKYIEHSLMSRADKDILQQYIDEFRFCYAGLCLSNGMTEIVCRDFDKQIRAKLEKYGVVSYERYVDDILVILNSHISKNYFIEIINKVIEEVFEDCPVKLNYEPHKFSYISRREIVSVQGFDFLGYHFDILFNNKVKFKFGIAERKRCKYYNIIEQVYLDYKRNGNMELFRQRIKMYSARVVIARSLGDDSFEWLTKGVIANYNELRFHMKDLDSRTKEFLEKTHMRLLHKHNIKEPYFMVNSDKDNSIYNLSSTLERNRSIVFEKTIGVKRKDLLNWIRKLKPFYDDTNKNYYRIVIEYLEILKVE